MTDHRKRWEQTIQTEFTDEEMDLLRRGMEQDGAVGVMAMSTWCRWKLLDAVERGLGEN